ncbi:DNA polymerase III subunit beta [Moraxella sp. FZFQ2102]|uniref:DNA polymerase III subunit beta n=1 Tax=Moraxella sp. FZFQ2102 TaxID=2953752 RepID=UPI00209BDF88|nr:DNA polymerase III subunit beta [Moraxella sp. FZFQ2102]USZ15799.1 DNA polymerase III subunit beta [Moraxella sp. FZFQ2102]
MKLSINRELLIKAINLVVKAADKRHRFVILGNIKLVLDQQSLTLTASDLELELTTRFEIPEGACLQAGSTTLPAEMFFNICKSLSEEMVTIDAPEGTTRCLITSGKGKYTLSSLPAQDFPSIGTASASNIIKITQGDLTSLIHHTRFAMATQDVRHYLTGMLFEIQDNKLTAVATDGHRLAVAHRVLSENYETSQMIIPGKAVLELERLLLELAKTNDDTEVVELGFDGEFLQVGLVLSDTETHSQLVVSLSARLIEGKFPDYRRVLPTNNDKIAQFDKEAAVDVLRRISVLNSKEAPGVLLEFDQAEVCKVGVNNRDQGEAEELLAVSYQGAPIELSFNESYLRAVLGVLDGRIQLEMNQPSTPALIHQIGDELHQYVIMPMRV